MGGKVLVIGLGLIGGSLALCIKKAHPHAHIIGYDVDKKQLQLGLSLGVIDEAAEDWKNEVVKADLIILSTPVIQTERLLHELSQLPLKNGVIVTDTGSTKGRIMEQATQLHEKGITFIGGHPMAGSHKSGVIAAKDILFENAFYLLTPFDGADEDVKRLKTWLKETKAKFVQVKPDEHDMMTGVISHFPHIIAASLVHQAEKFGGEFPLLSRLAAGGFRDITRIASSDPRMWKEITIHNKEVMQQLLRYWKREMEHIDRMLEQEDSENIYAYFQKAKTFRDDLPAFQQGAIPSFYDLYVDVPDYPGVISEITGYLADEQISITNIRIMETREDIYGILVISFQNDQDRKRAEQCIKRHTDYEVFLA
ncbi:MAG: prephenate dehydrogenase [Bacillus sp. (in: Bacteria)]|jgi:prephenate dehydrogenase|nr:prephenate dehydrogenase [Bacillus sp. (in: firmicutes)]